jgi:hypothetical protein
MRLAKMREIHAIFPPQEAVRLCDGGVGADAEFTVVQCESVEG